MKKNLSIFKHWTPCSCSIIPWWIAISQTMPDSVTITAQYRTNAELIDFELLLLLHRLTSNFDIIRRTVTFWCIKSRKEFQWILSHNVAYVHRSNQIVSLNISFRITSFWHRRHFCMSLETDVQYYIVNIVIWHFEIEN